MFHVKWKEMLAAQLQAMAKSSTKVPKSFEGYTFSGKLRPGVVSARMSVPAGIRKPDYADTGMPAGEMALRGNNTIPLYKGDEIEALRKAGRLAREVLDVAAAALRPGITGDEIDRIVFDATVARGCYPSPLNYHGFPKSVCVSPNEVICHGIPDDRPIEDGDIVNLDVTLYTPEGFHADLNETYAVGEWQVTDWWIVVEGWGVGLWLASRIFFPDYLPHGPLAFQASSPPRFPPAGSVDDRSRKLVRCAYDALAAAVAVCKPGVMYRDLGSVITKVVDEHKFSVVRSYCGHGIGTLFHTAPNVPHYARNKAVGIMKAGHVFTIEPMVNEGSHADETWPDEWTAVTRGECARSRVAGRRGLPQPFPESLTLLLRILLSLSCLNPFPACRRQAVRAVRAHAAGHRDGRGDPHGAPGHRPHSYGVGRRCVREAGRGSDCARGRW